MFSRACKIVTFGICPMANEEYKVYKKLHLSILSSILTLMPNHAYLYHITRCTLAQNVPERRGGTNISHVYAMSSVATYHLTQEEAWGCLVGYNSEHFTGLQKIFRLDIQLQMEIFSLAIFSVINKKLGIQELTMNIEYVWGGKTPCKPPGPKVQQEQI